MSALLSQVVYRDPATVVRFLDLTHFARLFSFDNEGYFAVIVQIPQLDCFLDESTDETRKDVFAVGAFLASEKYWKPLQIDWTKRLAKDGVAYFRATSCKTVTGPFYHLRKQCGSLQKAKKVAAEIRADLENILLASNWIGFGIGIVMPDYKKVLKLIPEARLFYSPDPTIAAYSATMYEVLRAVRLRAPGHQVAYVIDESSYSPKIKKAFDALKKNHPAIGKTATTLIPLDDKVTPPLQMADLIASVTKDLFLEWARAANLRYAPLNAKWRNHFEKIGKWDEKYMLNSLIKNFKSPRFKKGLLPRQDAPKVTKSQRKAMRKALVKAIAAKASK